MTKKVLIVDDDPMLLSLVGEHLRNADYSVRSTTDGSNAIQLTYEWQPDLILLDIMLPGMDGLTVTRRIREFTSTPIVILSAKGQEADILRGFEAGVDDYIAKPFSSEELLARVRAVSRRFDRADLDYQWARYQHGDLLIDTEAGRVLKVGDEIELSATQFKLLATFAASMGKILSPEELLSAVWGPGYRAAKSILWVAISRLKQKIEDDPRDPQHIITVPRAGYVMPREPGGSYNGDSSNSKSGSKDTSVSNDEV
jgi:DNA-binding response OmpR family regulator